MKRSIRIKIHLPYKQEYVWRALTDAPLLGQWLMENDLKPSIGHEFTFQMPPQKGWDGMTYCKVIDVKPMTSIAYTYRGHASGEKALACAGVHLKTADKAVKGIFAQLNTILSFTLVPTCGGTTLELEHSGFNGLKLMIVSFIMRMGWKKQLCKKLPLVLEKIAKEELAKLNSNSC